MAPDEVQPGLLIPSVALGIQEAKYQGDETAKKLEKVREAYPDELPAKITAATYDSDLGVWACSWKRRTYDTNGQRTDHSDTLERGPTWCPAFPVGNGVMPPPAFPVDVWLRRRALSVKYDGTQRGVAYEFDWICGCTSLGSSGTGGAGGSLTTDCCPSHPTPITLHGSLTLTAGACAAYDGQTWTITYHGGGLWYGTLTVSGNTYRLGFECTSGGLAAYSDDVSAPTCAIASISAVSFNCSPFSMTANITFNCCPGATLLWSITE